MASRPRNYSASKMAIVWIVAVLTIPLYALLGLSTIFVKRLPPWVVRKLLRAHNHYTQSRPMDCRIPPDKSVPVYMERWWWIPRNPFLNVYLHVVRRSDDDRALHDHPFWSFSIVLDGGYFEHEIMEGGVHRRTWYGPGAMRFRWHGTKAHRLELKRVDVPNLIAEIKEWPIGRSESLRMDDDGFTELPVTTIFLTGPVLRRWGFHAGEHGWIDAYDWDAFCEAHDIKGMRMDGGSDAVVSEWNKI